MPKHTALLARQNQTEGSGRMDTAMALFLSLQVKNIHRLKENFKDTLFAASSRVPTKAASKSYFP